MFIFSPLNTLQRAKLQKNFYMTKYILFFFIKKSIFTKKEEFFHSSFRNLS